MLRSEPALVLVDVPEGPLAGLLLLELIKRDDVLALLLVHQPRYLVLDLVLDLPDIDLLQLLLQLIKSDSGLFLNSSCGLIRGGVIASNPRSR